MTSNYLNRFLKVDSLFFFVKSVSWRMVYALSNAGINVNRKNVKGNTVLHIACMRGYVEINNNFFEVIN